MKVLAEADYQAARDSLEDLVERGYLDSASQLAFILIKSGKGIEDYKRAEKLLESFIATHNQDYHARKNLAFVKTTKTGDHYGAVKIYQTLLSEGYWECAHNVGMLAEKGLVTQTDLDEFGAAGAEENYKMAASNGHVFSKLALRRIKRTNSLESLVDYWIYRFVIAPVLIVILAAKDRNDRRLLV